MVIAFRPLRLASASHLPLAGEDSCNPAFTLSGGFRTVEARYTGLLRVTKNRWA